MKYKKYMVYTRMDKIVVIIKKIKFSGNYCEKECVKCPCCRKLMEVNNCIKNKYKYYGEKLII